MAVLEGIRKRTGLLLIVVAGALILFLVQGFAQDFIGYLDADQNVFKGQIGKERVKQEEFNAKVSQREALVKYNYEQQGQEVPAYLVTQIRSQIWNDYVYEFAFKPIYEAAGAFVSVDAEETPGDPEKVDLMQGLTVAEEVKQQFSDQEGNFDVENVKQLWRQIGQIEDAQKRDVETYRMNQWVMDLVRQRHQNKFNSLFSASNYVTLAEAKRQHYADNSTVSFDYAYIPFSSMADSLITFTDSDLKKHLETYKNKFEFKSGRTLEYVVFDVQPSKEDTAKIYTAAVKAADGFRKTSNDTSFYKMNSDRPASPTAYSVDQMPDALKEDSAFFAPGYVKGPVVEFDSYDVYKILSKQNAEFAQTAHILINFGEDSVASKIKALEVLDKAKKGEDFGALAAEYSEDPGSKDNKGEYPVQERNGQWVKEFEDAVFNATSKGVIPELVQTSFGYHIMKVLKVKYTEQKWVVVKISKELKASSQTKEMKYRDVSVFAKGLEDIDALKAKVEEDEKLEWLTSPLLTKNSKSIGAVYNADEVVMWAFSTQTELGDVKTFALNNSTKFVVVALKSISDKENPTIDDARDAIERSLYNEMKGKELKTLLESTEGDLHERVNKLNAKNGQGYATFQVVKDHKFSQNVVPGAGNEPKMVGVAMALGTEQGKDWSKTEIGQNGVFIVRTTAKNEATKEAADYNAEKQALKSKMNPNIEVSISNAIKEKVGVVDNEN